MVHAKDVVVVVATKVKASSSKISQVMHKDQVHVEVEPLEAGGAKEVAGISKEIMQEMMTENAGIVEEEVTFRVTVHQRVKATEDSKITMRLLAQIQIIQRHCL